MQNMQLVRNANSCFTFIKVGGCKKKPVRFMLFNGYFVFHESIDCIIPGKSGPESVFFQNSVKIFLEIWTSKIFYIYKMKQRRGHQFSSQLPEQQESIISLKIYYQHGSTLHVIASAACDNSVSPAIPWNMNRENVVNIHQSSSQVFSKQRTIWIGQYHQQILQIRRPRPRNWLSVLQNTKLT